MLYGRGSSGGLINRVSKKPGIDVTDFALSYGMWADRRAEADVGRVFADGAAAFRITGAVEKANSYRSQQFLDRKAIAPSVEFRLAPQTTVLLQADYLEDRRVTDFGIPAYKGRPVDVPASRYYGAANARDADYSQSRVYSSTATINHRFNDNWSIRNATRYYHYSLDRNNTLTSAVNEAAQTFTMNHGNVGREEHGWFNQTDLTQKASFFGMQHELLYGMEIGQQNKNQVNNTKPVPGTFDLFNPVLPTLARVAPGTPATNNLGVFNTLAFYTQDMVSFSEQWKALVGLRYDHFEQETLQNIAGLQNLSRTDNAWSPRAAWCGSRRRHSRTTCRGASRSSPPARRSRWRPTIRSSLRKPPTTPKSAPSMTSWTARPVRRSPSSAWSAPISRWPMPPTRR